MILVLFPIRPIITALTIGYNFITDVNDTIVQVSKGRAGKRRGGIYFVHGSKLFFYKKVWVYWHLSDCDCDLKMILRGNMVLGYPGEKFEMIC